MSINTEDIDIVEYSLSSIKHINTLLCDIENKVFNERLNDGEFAITKRQADLLLYLYELPNPPSIRELSRLLATSHQNVKKICEILESKELLSIVNDSKDRRKQRLKLTIKGEREAYNLSKALKEVASLVTPTFSSREIDELSNLLRKMETSIKEQSSINNRSSKN
ncbi:MAG: MarR family winged helix-turn-helix transcriptional regulator [Sphaerochaetaceae bacterium]|jgi:DNA-binding MarR family transcriptional regulator|nr:MarR family winged helix-turn-helix transcriptional regulator [Sphaerochaetaceae bacterium]